MLHVPDPLGVNVQTNVKVGGGLILPVIAVVEPMALADFDDGLSPWAITPLEVNGRPRTASVGEVDQGVSSWRLRGYRRERGEGHQEHSSQDQILNTIRFHWTFLRPQVNLSGHCSGSNDQTEYEDGGRSTLS